MIVETNYVTFRFPGTLFAEEHTERIHGWDVPEAVRRAIEVKAGRVYGFYFKTLAEMPDIQTSSCGPFRVIPKEVACSGMHYLGGTLRTAEQVMAGNKHDERTLRANMRDSRIAVVVQVTRGHTTTRPFERKDCIVNAKGEIVMRGDDPRLDAARKQMEDRP